MSVTNEGIVLVTNDGTVVGLKTVFWWSQKSWRTKEFIFGKENPYTEVEK